MKDCPFCETFRTKRSTVTGLETTPNGEPLILLENKYFWVKRDEFPVTPHHLLIIPKRHVSRLTSLNSRERIWFWRTLEKVTEFLRDNHNTDEFNLGVNQGKSAGQTVDHLHIHIFDRYKGDVENPRGGIRNFKESLPGIEY